MSGLDWNQPEGHGEYKCSIGQVCFPNKWAKSVKDAERQVREQIEQLHPLNMSPELVEEYRNRFRGQPIACKFLYPTQNPNKIQKNTLNL